METAIALNSHGPFEGTFDTLIAAVTEAELIETLSGRRQLTVFAPTDKAFSDIGISVDDQGNLIVTDPAAGLLETLTLGEILTYHVTPGRRYSESVVNASMIPTLNGARIDVESELSGNIIATDVEASNGVIHAIGAVLIP